MVRQESDILGINKPPNGGFTLKNTGSHEYYSEPLKTTESVFFPPKEEHSGSDGFPLKPILWKQTHIVKQMEEHATALRAPNSLSRFSLSARRVFSSYKTKPRAGAHVCFCCSSHPSVPSISILRDTSLRIANFLGKCVSKK